MIKRIRFSTRTLLSITAVVALLVAYLVVPSIRATKFVSVIKAGNSVMAFAMLDKSLEILDKPNAYQHDLRAILEEACREPTEFIPIYGSSSNSFHDRSIMAEEKRVYFNELTATELIFGYREVRIQKGGRFCVLKVSFTTVRDPIIFFMTD